MVMRYVLVVFVLLAGVTTAMLSARAESHDSHAATKMPRDVAQQLRADQLEVQLILENARSRVEALTKRSNAILAEYSIKVEDVNFETGEIKRPAPTLPPAPPTPTPSPAPKKK